MRVLAIDTETTSLLPNRMMQLERQPYLIQFCGLTADLDSGAILDEVTFFVKPPRKDLLTEKITEITRITWEMMEKAKSFVEVVDKVKDLVEAAPAVAAHNLSFDKDVIDFEAKRAGRAIRWPARMICTVEQTIHLKGIRLDLGSLHELLLGEKFADAHRADVDTKALVRCLVEMRRRDML